MLTLEQRLQGGLLGAVLGERWSELVGWGWQPQAAGRWGQWLYQGCAYWSGRAAQVPTASTAAEALVLVLPGFALCYPDLEPLSEVVTTAGLPPVVRDWARVLGLAFQGQVGEPLADGASWPELAESVADFCGGADDPMTTLTLGVRRGHSALSLFLTGHLLGAYGGAGAFPSAAVVSRLSDAAWRTWGTALLTRWAGVRAGCSPWAVVPTLGSR